MWTTSLYNLLLKIICSILVLLLIINSTTSKYIVKRRNIREAPIFTNKTSLILGTSLSYVENDQSEVTQVCDESNAENYNIYCSGRILEAVNYHHVYNDSKTFVDKPLIYDPANVSTKFDETFPLSLAIEEINKEKLLNFLKENFLEEGTELTR